MTRPHVDVLVVTWNTGAVTAAALRRLLDAEHGVVLRVLVHDNASADGTVAVLAEQVPEAEVVVDDVNRGFAAGVNALLARATAPWLLVLNSDAWPDPGAVDRLVEVALGDPGIGLVAPRLETPDGVLELSCLPAPSLATAWAAALGAERWAPRWSDRRLLPGAWCHDVPRDVDWAVGAAWLVRREAVESAGPMDTSLFMYGEDVEWCLRMRAAGWRLRFEPSAVVRHVGNASGSQAYSPHERARSWVRNDVLLFRRRSSRVATAAYVAARVVAARRTARARARGGDDGAAAHWRAVASGYLAAGRRTGATAREP
ncbi:MAG: glycosyltransferase family 2 protein [Actinomycetes bacterium]